MPWNKASAQAKEEERQQQKAGKGKFEISLKKSALSEKQEPERTGKFDRPELKRAEKVAKPEEEKTKIETSLKHVAQKSAFEVLTLKTFLQK